VTKRFPDESYEHFRKRRLQENQELKRYLRGQLIHPSTVYYDDPDGKLIKRSNTYRRPENA